MQTNITTRHTNIDESIKLYINEKLNKLSKYSDKIEEARVVLSREKFNYIAEIILIGKRFRMTATRKDEGLRVSFDKCVTNVEKQLKRFRTKVKDRHAGRLFKGFKRFSLRKKQVAQLSPQIIRTDTAATKPMAPEEAAMELEVFKKEFMVFRNSETDEMNVLYRRKDGNYGLVEA
ncbi:MAG: ribosome-associated translation inhibitor RaiA [Candidatus Omnitrophica bacterium]|nr:ribosome-associated translation inhibitor RaiA [Candidatus Omnitrophota bacterium]